MAAAEAADLEIGPTESSRSDRFLLFSTALRAGLSALAGPARRTRRTSVST